MGNGNLLLSTQNIPFNIEQGGPKILNCEVRLTADQSDSAVEMKVLWGDEGSPIVKKNRKRLGLDKKGKGKGICSAFQGRFKKIMEDNLPQPAESDESSGVR